MRVVVTGASGTPTESDYDTLLSIEKAKRLLGYEPEHSWRDALESA